MQSVEGNLLTRRDTFFGVCEAIGQDFGFHPNWLRAVFGVLFLWNPLWVGAGYAALGAVVALSRWIVPNPRPAEAPAPQAAPTAPAAAEQEEVLLAA